MKPFLTAIPDHAPRAVDLILDSGAFSAWRKMETLRVEDYIEFIQRYHGCFHEVVNLDVIPGAFGKKPSAEEVERSAGLGWKNMEVMRAAGIKPMHVFHQGERFYWLEKMIDEGLDYIGISPANDRTTKQKMQWLDSVFGFLCGDRGFPSVRTHGFGVTSLPILFRYPFYSVDSVSWILFGAYGQILIPKWNDVTQDYDYTQPPYVIHVSQRGKDDAHRRPAGAVALDMDGGYDHQGPMMKAYINGYLEHEGMKLEDTRNDALGRLRVNCRFYKRIGERAVNRPFFQRRSLHSHETSRFGVDVCPFQGLRMVFTTTGTGEDEGLLNEEGIRERLISWYHIRAGNAVDIAHFVLTGNVRVNRKKRKRREVPAVQV